MKTHSENFVRARNLTDSCITLEWYYERAQHLYIWSEYNWRSWDLLKCWKVRQWSDNGRLRRWGCFFFCPPLSNADDNSISTTEANDVVEKEPGTRLYREVVSYSLTIIIGGSGDQQVRPKPSTAMMSCGNCLAIWLLIYMRKALWWIKQPCWCNLRLRLFLNGWLATPNWVV